MKRLKWTILFSINIVLIFICFWTLVFLNAYYNGAFIPDSFIWVNGVMPSKPLLIGVLENDLILCIEAILILSIFYLLNRWLFIDLLNIENPKFISKKIYKISIIIMLVILIMVSILRY